MDMKIKNLIIIAFLRIVPLFLAFLSEADMLIASLRGEHSEMWYILLRLIIAIIILLAVSNICKGFEEKLRAGGRTDESGK